MGMSGTDGDNAAKPMTAEPAAPVRLRVARGRGLVRGVIAGSLGLLLFAPAGLVLPRLHFVPSAVDNRLGNYCWAVIVVAIAAGGVAAVWSGLRWAAYAVWPAGMAIVADAGGLHFRLGPLGRRDFDWADMRATYRSELSADTDDMALLDFDDPDEEVARRLPILRHRGATEEVNVLLLRFAADDEPALADKLRPFVEGVRRRDVAAS